MSVGSIDLDLIGQDHLRAGAVACTNYQVGASRSGRDAERPYLVAADYGWTAAAASA